MGLTVLAHNFARSLMLPLKELDKNLPKSGKIIDLGCGEGVVAAFLAKQKNRQVIGIDLNSRRIQETQVKNLKFLVADIRTYNLKDAGGVVLSDVLHHVDHDDQQKILTNISSSLKKDARLIIKEISTEEFIRSKLSRFWDFVFYPKEKIYFRKASDLVKMLENLGFSVRIKSASHFFPGSTNIFICTKK